MSNPRGERKWYSTASDGAGVIREVKENGTQLQARWRNPRDERKCD